MHKPIMTLKEVMDAEEPKASADCAPARCSAADVCYSLFAAELALDNLSATYGHETALGRETQAILAALQQRRHALERLQRQQQNAELSESAQEKQSL